MHFAGRFQADTSTINNDVRHYKSDAFLPQFQAPMVGHGGGGADRTNGYWNPEGTGAWRMIGCRVTSVALPGRRLTADTQDGAVGLRLGGSSDRVAGKLVDLDPQQQLASQIWGLRVTLIDARGEALLDSRYEVGTFTDLWKRQQIPQNFDQTLGAAFQSTLCDLTWGDLAASPALGRLRAASRDGILSIRFNVFGFDRDPTADDYTTGLVIGTIGPAARREPRFFVAGRQLVAATPADNPSGRSTGSMASRPSTTPAAARSSPTSATRSRSSPPPVTSSTSARSSSPSAAAMTSPRVRPSPTPTSRSSARCFIARPAGTRRPPASSTSTMARIPGSANTSPNHR
ncbi:MAG: hypothetical protein R3F65_18740 [bacterium]